MDKTSVLSQLGFSEKEISVYLALLSLGPSPIRKIGERANVNRGTTHDALKNLQKEGLVSYYHKEKHQYFVAEDPVSLQSLVKRKKLELEETREGIETIIPELKSLFSGNESKPVVKYYEDDIGIRTILEDVLNQTEHTKEKEYRVYSSANIRPYLYKKYQKFTEDRIKRNIFVRAIAIGDGGKESGNDERRWLKSEGEAPTYTLIYAGKVAMISVNKKNTPHGVIIEDQNLSETQKLIFDALWDKLKRK